MIILVLNLSLSYTNILVYSSLTVIKYANKSIKHIYLTMSEALLISIKGKILTTQNLLLRNLFSSTTVSQQILQNQLHTAIQEFF